MMISKRTMQVAAAAVALVWLAAAPAAAQSPSAGETWSAPRTSWGDPDLQGIWTNATLTPVERPESLAATEVLSTEEAAALEVQTADSRRENDRFIPGVVGAYNQFWMDAGTTVVESRRTSLVVDPPDGRIPWSEAGRARLESDLSRYGVGPYNSWVDADTGERCLTDGLPLVPLQGYNMNTHILQTPGWVAILNEMFHRVPHRPGGRARGHRSRHRPVAGRRGGPVGRRHPGRREHALRRPGPLPVAVDVARAASHAAPRRAVHARRRGEHRLRVHDDRPGDVHPGPGRRRSR